MPTGGMAASDSTQRLLPDYLYRSRGALAALAGTAASSACGGRSRSTSGLGHVHDDVLRRFRRGTCFESERVGSTGRNSGRDGGWGKFMIPGANETRQIPLYTGEFYAYCAVGGILSCGITHTGVTPLDIVKCNMQIDPGKYTSIGGGFKLIMAEQGIKGLYKGWGPTVVGYSLQGACKFGLYEFFKHTYAEIAGEPFATDHKSLVFLAGSASAEFVADIALCPFEAVKVRVQTQPGYANGLTDGMSKFLAAEGFAGLYGGIVPLWGRQIPYTMMKFTSFEATVDALYAHVVPIPKEKCSKGYQLGVSFAAGYIAGVLCAIVSHPADNIVSYMNSRKGASIGQAVSDIGMVNLFTRGLPLRIFMIGTLTGAQWGIYDAFKVYVGLPTTGGAAPAHGGGGGGGGKRPC
ncbi:hypothetical protein KC19_5G055600 [Ceratodon purpureus]|uniref:Uncharacterized protein n=1 Tax=Ceratodon purpureus TaxID=3225 RepID=A0A8T0HZI8_CERPU|nr:hypothetical protein KC19_5G055600 [Ceratodon purpureus]